MDGEAMDDFEDFDNAESPAAGVAVGVTGESETPQFGAGAVKAEYWPAVVFDFFES